ncbi:MAG TPA: DUF4157 domain-containing protein, partial [Chitinophagaceae bacterium]
MKVAKANTAATPAKSKTPFFSKEGSNGLFSKSQDETFFNKRDNSSLLIQRKLTIGPASDKYEQEADATAGKVVQKLSENKPYLPNQNGNSIQAKFNTPITPTITPVQKPQTKIADAQPEEKLQKKDEEKEAPKEKLQKKPIFESNAEPPDDNEEKNIQRKCAECEKEEKIQKKDGGTEHGKDKPDGTLQRKPIFESNADPSEKEKSIQRKSAASEQLQKKSGTDSSEADSKNIESSLSSTKGSGSLLPQNTREQMESSFGADFSKVRLHNDSTAAKMSDNLNAQAFTHGNDIYFNAGKYDTGSEQGKHLLAHELTHTLQQGASARNKENDTHKNELVQKAPGIAKAAAPTSSEVVDISKGTFSPSDTVKKEIEDAKDKGLDVRIKAGAFAAEGTIRIKKKGEDYDSHSPAYLSLTNAWLQKISVLALRVDVKSNQVTGLITIKGGGSDVSAWLASLKKMEAEIGMGFHFKGLPDTSNIINKLENGTLSIGFTDFTISIGGFFDLKLSLTLENMNTPIFQGSATMKLKGAEGQVNVDNTHGGKLGGSGSLTITGFKGFSGQIEVKYDAETGNLDIHGKADYTGDKLSGSIELIATDADTAKNFSKDAIAAAGGKNKVQDAAPPAPVPAPSGTKPRALAGAGQLQFNLTKWFAGTVNVVVDAEGHVTVIGKIAPPAEIELFKQKNWDKELFKLEAKAYYGIPVVGDLNLFANISLHAIAKLGPAKIYNIEILGTYSTDPAIQKNIQIAGSINISAYAGLSLRAEGGAGIEILSHDLKFGVGVQADVGAQAYADARPTIGWREPDQFYISGTLEIVAQPMLGLGGDFFIQIETPWWSPLSDKKWTWPLFSKQWPLGDPIGISATIKDYVLGSGDVPEIEFKKPEFDASKFMTNMVDNNLPDKAGEDGPGKGDFKDDGTATKPDVPDKNAGKKGADKESPKGKKDVSTKPTKAKPDPKAAQEAGKIFQDAGKQLEQAHPKEPITKADLRAKLNEIEKKVNGIRYDIRLAGEQWEVSSSAKGIDNDKHVKFGATLTDEDKKGNKNDPIKIHQTFDVEGQAHELDTKDGSDELVMFSNPVNLSSHPDKDVRDAHDDYLTAIEDPKAKSPTAKIKKANEKILIIISKIKAAKMASAPGASAPGIGTID